MEEAVRHELDLALARLADGDRSAFHPVYTTAWPVVRRHAARLIDDPVEAEDIAQQALLAVFERSWRYDPSRPALPWILGIVTWEARTARKRRSRRREDELGDLSGIDDPEEAVINRQLEVALEEVMGELRPADVAVLRSAAGLDERPQIGAAAWRKRLQRARQRLRTAWEARHG